MKNLNVPYKSQWDDDATATANDCGPASIAMILSFYNKNLSTNDVFYKSGAGQGYVTFAQMTKAIADYGFRYEIVTGQTIEKMKSLIDSGIPPIVLIHYGALSTRQDKGFKGPHFVVLNGYDENGYYVKDPDFWGNYRNDGDNHFYTKAEFEEAWSTCHIDGNPDNSLIIIYPNQQTNQNVADHEQCNIKIKALQLDIDELIKDRNRLNDVIGFVKDPLILRWKAVADFFSLSNEEMNKAPEISLSKIKALKKSVDGFQDEMEAKLAIKDRECEQKISEISLAHKEELDTLKEKHNKEIEEEKKNKKIVYVDKPIEIFYKDKSTVERLKILLKILFSN